MKRNIFLVYFVWSVIGSLSLGAQDFEWVRQFGAPDESDIAAATSTDGSVVYVAGSTTGTVAGVSNSGSFDAYVRAYDLDGEELWTRQLGTELGDRALAVAAHSGSVYVGGIWGFTPSQFNPGSGGDAFVHKYDADGTELWTRDFGVPGTGSSATDYVNALAADDSGVYVGAVEETIGPGSFLVVSVRRYDPEGNEIWHERFGSFAVQVGVNGIALDASGVYIAGQLWFALPDQTFAGLIDAFVRKYDRDGNEVWTDQFGTAEIDKVNGISISGSGVYVSGAAYDVLPGQTGAGHIDAFVRRYDPAGNELWTRQFGTDRWDQSYSVFADSSGVHVAGETYGDFAGQTAGSGNRDAFVRRYDANGNDIWTEQFGIDGDADVRALSGDASNLYVAGFTTGDAYLAALPWRRGFDPGWTRDFGTDAVDEGSAVAADDSGVYVVGATDGILSTLPGGGGARDAYVRKLDPLGKELWTRQTGTAATDEAGAVSARDGEVFVAGTTAGTLPGEVSAGGTDGFVWRLSPDGSSSWLVQFGTAANDATTSVSGNVAFAYAAGWTMGTFAGETSAGGTDAFLTKYLSQDATPLWTRQFGTASQDLARATYHDAIRGVVYVAGLTIGALPGQTSAGSADGFVRKYDNFGAELWTDQFGTAGVDEARAVWADGLGVYVAGVTLGAFSGQSSEGGKDGFIRKYSVTGDELWTRQFGTSLSDEAWSLSDDPGGLLVGGWTVGVFPAASSAGGFSDGFVCKYGFDGRALWTRQFGSPGTDEVTSISTAATGVYAAGTLNSSDVLATLVSWPTTIFYRLPAAPFCPPVRGSVNDRELEVSIELNSVREEIAGVGARLLYDDRADLLDIEKGAGLPESWSFAYQTSSAGQLDFVLTDQTSSAATIAGPVTTEVLSLLFACDDCEDLQYSFAVEPPGPGAATAAFPFNHYALVLDSVGYSVVLDAAETTPGTGPGLLDDHAFLRGNINNRRAHRLDLGHVIDLANFLFTGFDLDFDCAAASDVNDDGAYDIVDLVALVQGVFRPSAVVIPAPNAQNPGFGSPGTVTVDGGGIPSALGCEEGEICP